MANTKTGEPEPGERSPLQSAIIEALLRSPSPLVPGELARRIRKDQSNVRRTADQMVLEGVLIRRSPPERNRRPGRQPRVAYELADPETAELEVELRTDPGKLRKGQQVVFASIDADHHHDVMEVVRKWGSELGLEWVTSVDGDRQERVFTFEGDDAEARASDLISALSALRVDCHRGVVGDVIDGRRAVADAIRAAEIAEEATRGQAARLGAW
jgi:MarR family